MGCFEPLGKLFFEFAQVKFEFEKDSRNSDIVNHHCRQIYRTGVYSRTFYKSSMKELAKVTVHLEVVGPVGLSHRINQMYNCITNTQPSVLRRDPVMLAMF